MFARFMHPLVAFDGGEPGPATPPEPTPDPAVVPPAGPSKEFAELRRKADEAERRAKAAEDELAEQARKKAEEEGRWKDIADQEKAAREAIEVTLEKNRQDAEIAAIALELKFHNPGDVLHRLTDEQRTDPVKARGALEAIAKKDTYLVQRDAPEPPVIGRVLDPSAIPNTQPAPLTAADIESMSTAEINDRWDEVQAVLAAEYAATHPK